MKLKFFWKVKKHSKGSDGLYRIIFDVYEGGNSIDIAASLSKTTGYEWKGLGTFMDSACVATKVRPPKEFSFIADCSF